jgi:hypothetical protein
MNTRKRYLALAATAIICTASLPLGAMKQPDQQKNNRVTPKMVFLQAVEKQDLDYIKNNITSMDPTTLQTALNALQDFQESEMYTFIANYVSPQPPQNDKKRNPRKNHFEGGKRR